MRRDSVVFAAVEEPDVVHAVARRDTLGAKPYSRTSLRRGGTDAAATIAERGRDARAYVARYCEKMSFRARVVAARAGTTKVEDTKYVAIVSLVLRRGKCASYNKSRIMSP